MPKVELERNAITIATDSTGNTVEVVYNDPDILKNLNTCILGIWELYKRGLAAGISESELSEVIGLKPGEG